MFTLILVFVYGVGSGMTSQSVSGFSSRPACEQAGATIKSDITIGRFSCVEVK